MCWREVPRCRTSCHYSAEIPNTNNQTNDETEFSLVYDTTSMSDTDVLQIFTDMDYQEITPSEDMLDPLPEEEPDLELSSHNLLLKVFKLIT